MLKDLIIEEEYRSDTNPPIQFYINCLKHSIQFDRAAGYFSSSGLAEASKGFAHFINNDGFVRLVVSPEFNEDDINAIIKGYKSRDEIITEVLTRSIAEIEDNIQKNRLEALSWLVATNKLEIKIAIKVDKDGNPENRIYHEKMGIFVDSNNDAVAFSGSTNESKGGWVENFESIDVFKSWTSIEKNRVSRKKQNFEKLWNNATDFLVVQPIPKAIKQIIVNDLPPRSCTGF